MSDLANEIPNYKAGEISLAGRSILLTGAGGGFGAALTMAMARYGATVVMMGRKQAAMNQVYDEVVAAGYPEPHLVYLDHLGAGAAEYEVVAESIGDAFENLNGVVINAAMLGELSTITSYAAESWAKVMHVNATAPFLLMQALLPLLHHTNDASVVFISDQLGRRARAYWGAYAASKFALEGLCQVLAAELESQKNIRVNSYAPGPMRTQLRRQAYPGEDATKVPLPETFVDDVCFLLSTNSASIHGQALRAATA